MRFCCDAHSGVGIGVGFAHDFLGEEWGTPSDLAGGKRSDILFGPSPPICAKGNRLAQPFWTARGDVLGKGGVGLKGA